MHVIPVYTLEKAIQKVGNQDYRAECSGPPKYMSRPEPESIQTKFTTYFFYTTTRLQPKTFHRCLLIN